MEFEIEFLISLKFGFSFKVTYMFSPSKTILDLKKLGQHLDSEKIQGKKNLGPKQFLVHKILGPQNFGSKKTLGKKKFEGQQKLR